MAKKEKTKSKKVPKSTASKNKQKAILLLSTGIDSPVAAKRMSKSFEVIGVHFAQSEKSLEGVKKICKKTGIKKLYVVDHVEVLKEISEKGNKRFTCVLCKRFMIEIADKVADKEKADYIITGENLGQVASQTIDNLKVTDDATDRIVLRPLLTLDKNETTELAKKYDTYEISNAYNFGCPFLPLHPVTKAKLKKVKEEVEKIGFDNLIGKVKFKVVKV